MIGAAAIARAGRRTAVARIFPRAPVARKARSRARRDAPDRLSPGGHQKEDAAALLWFTRAMSPAPRKPAKPKPPATPEATPTVKPPRPATPKRLEGLEKALGEKDALPGPDVAIRFDVKPPSARALKKLGITDERAAELAKHLAGRTDEITGRLAGDRELTALLAGDPAAALEKLEIPEKLRTGGDDDLRSQFLDRFRGVKVELPPIGLDPRKGIPTDAATQAKLELIAGTFARASADPATGAALRTDPLPVVTDVAASISPGGLGATSTATASVVTEVSNTIRAVYGMPQALRIDPGTVVRIPRSFKGA